MIEAYGNFGSFQQEMYFTLRYGGVPSEMELELPLKGESGAYARLLELLGPKDFGLKLHHKNWSIDDSADATPDDDRIDRAFLDSTTLPLCVQLTLRSKDANFTFYYDCHHADLEERLLDLVGRLRRALGESRAPYLRVLTRDQHGYGTRRIRIEPFTADLARDYNDDLATVDERIRRAIEEEESGLILLHGIPGTGKTSYIKSLLTEYAQQRFIFVPNDFVSSLLKPDFISFLMGQRNCILLIEDAEKVIMARERAGNDSVVSTLLQLTDGLFSDYLNIKIICTFNTDVSRIDQALFRKGRLIAFYEFRELVEEKARIILADNGITTPPERRTLAELYNAGEQTFEESAPRRIGFAAKN